MVTKRIDLHKLILDCPNFPKQGVLFRDISPVFRNNDALNYIADEFQGILKSYKFDTIVGIESRGFVVATVLALRFGKGLTMIRKAGKLPGETIRKSYDIEYGNAIMEIQRDAISDGQTVLIVDDSDSRRRYRWGCGAISEGTRGQNCNFCLRDRVGWPSGSDEVKADGTRGLFVSGV